MAYLCHPSTEEVNTGAIDDPYSRKTLFNSRFRQIKYLNVQKTFGENMKYLYELENKRELLKINKRG